MPSTFDSLLAGLYGETTGRRVASRLESRIAAGMSGATDSFRPLDQSDALAIAYADHVQVPGEPPLVTLGDFAEQHLLGLVSGLHLLPFHPWSSDDGFSVKDYAAVDPGYGTWDDLDRLGRRFDLMLDAVFNHLSAQSGWFQRFAAGDPAFADFFVAVEGDPDLSAVVRPRTLPLLTEFPTSAGRRRLWTTFGPDQVDLNFRNPEVLLAIVDALLGYVGHGARFIRLDAIAFLWKEPGTSCLHLPAAHAVVRLFRAILDEVAPDVRLITETNVPHADNVSYFGNGRDEAQLVYNFALPPLVVHAFRTGDARPLTSWARSLVLPSDRVTFFNFLASHDGIGLNPARGLLSAGEIDALARGTLERGGFVSMKNLPDGSQAPYEMNINYLDALAPVSDPADIRELGNRFLSAHAIQLALQGVPGLYLHSLMGSRGDRAGAVASGIPRRINREKLLRAPLESELADPGSLRNAVYVGLRDLLTTRRRHDAFAPGASQRVLETDPRLFAVVRGETGATRPVLCLQNTSSDPVAIELPAGFREQRLEWLAGNGAAARPDSGPVTLGPHGLAWLTPA